MVTLANTAQTHCSARIPPTVYSPKSRSRLTFFFSLPNAVNLGGVRFVMGEPDEAIRLFTLGLTMNPRHPLLQYSIGNAFASQGRSEEAARSFEATLRIQPDFAAARTHLLKIKREMRTRWLPSGGVAGACAFLLLICVAVQRAVSAFALGAHAVQEANQRNVTRYGVFVGGG